MHLSCERWELDLGSDDQAVAQARPKER